MQKRPTTMKPLTNVILERVGPPMSPAELSLPATEVRNTGEVAVSLTILNLGCACSHSLG